MFKTFLFRSFCICMIGVFPIIGKAEESSILSVPIERIEEVIHLGFSMNQEVWNKVDAIIADYPDSPVGLVIQTYGHLWDHIYGKNDRSIQEWETSALQSLEFAKSYHSSNSEDVDAEFILAVNELGLAKYYIHNRQWIKALFKTKSGWARVKRILKHNPTHYDTAYAVGMMNCYFDNTPLFLKPFAVLFGFRGNIDKGLIQLSEAAENGLICRIDARYSLWEVHCWLLGNEEPSIEHIEKLAVEFPQNVFFQDRLALTEAKFEQQSKAIERFEHVLMMGNISRYIGTQIHATYALTSELNKLENDEEVIKRADQLLSLAKDKKDFSWYVNWAWVFKGQAYNRLGQFEQSKESWSKVSSKYSDAYKLAKTALEELR